MLPELEDSTPFLDEPSRMRQKMEENGYLLCRGVLPRDVVLDVRRAMLGECAAHGLLRQGTDPLEGRIDPACRPSPAFQRSALRLERVRTLWHHPALLRVMSDLLGEQALPHPGFFARALWPRAGATEPHQDGDSACSDEEVFYTMWIPLGACPVELGPVEYLLGSHRQGLLDTSTINPSGSGGPDPATLEGDWATASFQAGDIVIHHMHLVHGSMVNRTEDRARLSLDCHYQPLSKPLSSPFTHAMFWSPEDLSWEEIYQGWQSSELQYYWRRPEVRHLASLDNPRMVARYERAFAAARKGNPHAVSALRTLLEHWEIPRLRERSEQVLGELAAHLAAGRPRDDASRPWHDGAMYWTQA